MGEHISNLLIGTGTTVNSDKYNVVTYKTTEPLVVGTTYTISIYVEELECEGKTPVLELADGNGYVGQGLLKGNTPGVHTLTFVYKRPYPEHSDPNHIMMYNTSYSSAKYKAVLHHVMMVKGAEPAAWAPAEGETLTADAVVVDAMSSNLLHGITPSLSNGTVKEGNDYIIPKFPSTTVCHECCLLYSGIQLPKQTSNRRLYIGFGHKAISANDVGVRAVIGYKDDGGNTNWASVNISNTNTAWNWFSGYITIPSGMTLYVFHISANKGGGGMRITNVTLSYDSPVVLAMSEMTATDIENGTNWKGADGISIASVTIQD